MKTWNIQYAGDTRPSLQVHGSREKAERIAVRRNKYREGFSVTEAPRPDLTIEKEKAYDEAIRYGCSLPPRG